MFFGKVHTIIHNFLDRAPISGLFICIFFLYAFPAYASPTIEASSFKPGEKLIYQLRWGIIPAGYATLEVLENKTLQDKKTRHFRLTAQSNSFIDTFFKVRDKVESFTDQHINQTVLYKKKQHEGSTIRDVTVSFDLQNMKARYQNQDIDNDPIDILPGTLDPLSAFYHIRNADLKKGVVISKPVTDGKKTLVAEAKVVKRESVTIRGEKYDTYLVEPDLKGVQGVFDQKQGSKIKLWFTADERHLLVKIKSKVAVGSFYGVLIGKENIN